MRNRRQHPNPRTTTQRARALTIMDVIASEASALKLAVAAGDTDDFAYTLANLHALVEQAQAGYLDQATIETVAPGIWATNGHLTLPKHSRRSEEAGS